MMPNRADERAMAVGRMACDLAHDLNNQMMAVLGFCELALSQADPASQLARDLLEVKAAGERAAAMTRQLLALRSGGAREIAP